MKSVIVTVLSLWLLSSLTTRSASADDEGAGSSGGGQTNTFGSDPRDPSNFLQDVEQRRAQRDSLFPVSPLKPIHDSLDPAKKRLYGATGLKMGLTLNHVFQGISDSIAGSDRSGSTTDADLVAGWELINRGEANPGKLYAHLEGRWDYGTTGPQNLGFVNLGSQIGTANAFSAYDNPTFLIRNLYWEQGSQEAGWAFRVGKVTPDAILATSRHITPVTTFLPNGGTGLFASGYPDSGLGFVGALYPSDDFKIIGVFSDANANRFDWGDIGAGDYYKALEFGYKIMPKTENAGYSKLTFWHNDGTKDGKPINASTGKEGWGMTVKHEHEFTNDGNVVGVARWGKAWQKSSLYDQQVGLHLLVYDPDLVGTIDNDLIGIAGNWVDASAVGSRDEYNLELFYRFPLFPVVDATLSYQSVFNPALNTAFDHASVFTLRLRSVF